MQHKVGSGCNNNNKGNSTSSASDFGDRRDSSSLPRSSIASAPNRPIEPPAAFVGLPDQTRNAAVHKRAESRAVGFVRLLRLIADCEADRGLPLAHHRLEGQRGQRGSQAFPLAGTPLLPLPASHLLRVIVNGWPQHSPFASPESPTPLLLQL